MTYLPLAADAFVLGHSRDELLSRQSQKIESLQDPIAAIYPIDPVSGGTWIASSRHMAVAVLNGSRRKHQRQPPYRRSRGLVVLDMLKYLDVTAFASQYDFDNIEPFTLICRTSEHLAEVHWDGTLVDVVGLDPTKPQIWASWTLYDAALQDRRRLWFVEWYLNHPGADSEALMNFHLEAGDDEHHIVRAGTDLVQTISITTVAHTASSTSMICRHLDDFSEVRAKLS